MKVAIGTNHFPTESSAYSYYRQYLPLFSGGEVENLKRSVREKIASHEIIIGKPPLKENQELKIIDNRYHICE